LRGDVGLLSRAGKRIRGLMASRKRKETTIETLTIETKPCPQCGKRMIKRCVVAIYLIDPPLLPSFWWCKCGRWEEAGIERGKTISGFYEWIWELANQAKDE